MAHKVLLADDSLTIQKVIKITLANQPFEIVDAVNEKELFEKISSVKPKIVFLDFNLSERYSGFELTEKIKSLSPRTKVLLLLGTFDTVEDSAMIKSGASDKIVKPFDSNRFIAICKKLADEFGEDQETSPSTPTSMHSSDEDQWTLNQPTLPGQLVEETNQGIAHPKNDLHKVVEDWGMSVPNIIGVQGNTVVTSDLPPVIDLEPVKLPHSHDLDYPVENQSIDLKIDSSPTNFFEIETSYSEPETDILSIEKQIKDEVEDNFWSIDEIKRPTDDLVKNLETVKSGFQPSKNDFDPSLFTDDEISKISESFQATSVVSKAEVEKLVQKYVKEYLDQMFKTQVEKISWEVIPDLAENLIKKEISKISSQLNS